MSKDAGKKQAPLSTSFTSVITLVSIAVGAFVALQAQTGLFESYLNQTGLSRFLVFDKTIDVVDGAKAITYRGTASGGTEHFQNIFFAEDSSGQNRFAPPKPFLPESGSIVDATKSGAWCPQGTGDVLPFTSVVNNISENCLSLRIARPRGTQPRAKLPVVVFIHGGGHALGSASDIFYTPDGLIELSVEQGQPTIYVGINYRLGFFAYASTDALQAQKHGNAGLRDQRAALEWIQKHIAVFGGDPDRVTVLGHSCGAIDIGLHMTSYGGGKKGVPFQRAIMSSGATNLNFDIDGDSVKKRTLAVADSVGCTGATNTGSAEITRCLREADWEQLINVSVPMMRTARPPFGEHFFHPTIDGDILTHRPSELMRLGKFVKGVPLLSSWDYDEGAWYAPPTTQSDEEVLASFTLWMSNLSQESLDKLLELYPEQDFAYRVPPSSGLSPQYFRAAKLNRDLWFACPGLDFTWQYARQGGIQNIRLWETNSTRYRPVYDYMGVGFWGVAHLAPVAYFHNTKDLPGGIDSSPAQLALAREMASQVIAFVNERDEPAKLLADWTPAYAGNDEASLKGDQPRKINVKVFGGPDGSGMASVWRGSTGESVRDQRLAHERLLERCEFINSAKVRKELGV